MAAITTTACLFAPRLKRQLQCKLKSPGTVGIHGVQKGTARQAISAVSAGGAVVGHRASIATDRVLRLVAKCRIEDAELGVVEDVESLGPEFHIQTLVKREVLLQSGIEIPPLRIVQRVAACGTEGQAARGGECPWVAEQRAKTRAIRSFPGAPSARISDHIRIRP